RTSARVQPSWTRFWAATSVPIRAITASVTGNAVARYQGTRRSTGGMRPQGRRRSPVWTRGPVAGRRTGLPWLRLLLPLIATLATPLPPVSAGPAAPIRTSLTRSAPRPHVGAVGGHVGEQGPVEVRVLAQQARLVAAVQGRVAEPGRQGAGGGQLRLGAGGGHPGPVQLLAQLQLAGVGEPADEPGPADGHAVAAQRLLVAAPPQHRRGGAPAGGRGG